ncbi:MAG: glycosyltransferase family 2 protein [Puniceicoccales bacterium]|jgi:glycosyltransferase involved in cell wall biosynthesis|nr:glycosyltransferase family 2 protein [Puniceicoccales bacterium]
MTLSEQHQSGKYPLTALVIASNEERNIGRCLRSVGDWVAESLVVVNDCTDATVRVAKALGARVLEHTWEGYGAQKNFGSALATQSWILSLDADEEISPELRCSIQKFLSQNSSNYAAAYFQRMVCFQGRWIRHGDWYPDEQLRLYRKDRGRWTEHAVHEHLEVKGRIMRLRGPLHHYTYRSLREQVQVGLNYGELWLRDRKLRPVWVFEILARAFWRFFRGYLLKFGFLDGFLGLYIALSQSFLVFYRYTSLRECYEEKRWGQGERMS